MADDEKPCRHAYYVGPAISVVPTGTPCAKCGERYDPKAPRR